MTTTSKERVVQTQSPFIHFAEVPPPEGLILKEGQYFARDPVSGAFVVLDHKVLKSKVAKVTSISSTTSVDQQFHTPDRDEWDPEEITIEKLQQELNAFAKKCGV